MCILHSKGEIKYRKNGMSLNPKKIEEMCRVHECSFSLHHTGLKGIVTRGVVVEPKDIQSIDRSTDQLQALQVK